VVVSFLPFSQLVVLVMAITWFLVLFISIASGRLAIAVIAIAILFILAIASLVIAGLLVLVITWVSIRRFVVIAVGFLLRFLQTFCYLS
jgi:hypothetical protein